MFKRIEKRLLRREEERKLGIDDETRDVLGLNDTDSEESDSDSDLSNDASEAEGSEDESEGEDEGEEAWGGIGGDEVGDESDASDEEEDAGPRHIAFPVVTAQQALDDPIYDHPTQDNAHLCTICPGRTLISSQSISQHLASKAHERRSKHLAELASLPDNADSSLSDLIQLMEGRPRPGSHPEGQPEGEDTYASKRAEKKRKAVEIRKAKREKRKLKKVEKRKAEEEQDAREDTVVAKDNNKKRKAEFSSKSATAQPIAGKKETKLTGPTAVPDEKRKKEGKDVVAPRTEDAPAKKKRKASETGVRSEQQKAQKTKEIAKSVGSTDDSHAHAPVKKKRKAGARELTKSVGTMEDGHAPLKKKRKTEETGVPSEQEIAEKIRELTKSIAGAEDSHAHAPAKKKRKTGETGVKEATADSPAHAPAKKKHKTGETGVKESTKSAATAEDSSTKKKRQPRTDEGEQQVTQKIQDIAKSATKRARLAQSKANNGQGKRKKVV